LNKVLKKANNKELKSICECTLNILKGNVNLSHNKYKTLKPFKNHLHTLVKKRVPLKTKKQFIIQKGRGFIPLIASVAASLISSYLASKRS